MRALGPIWKVFFWKETEPASLLGVNKLARAGDTHTARSGGRVTILRGTSNWG